jgi:hypothetical protein
MAPADLRAPAHVTHMISEGFHPAAKGLVLGPPVRTPQLPLIISGKPGVDE